MEVFGNVDALKGSIEKKYASRIKEIERNRDKELKEIGKKLGKESELLKSHMKTVTNAEVKKAESMILSEERLKAKKEFEEKREGLIESVFKEADKKIRKIAQSDDYLKFVKENMPKEDNLKVVGGSEYYKQEFPDVVLDYAIAGLKFEIEGITYDFTIQNLIESKKEVLRKKISEALFR